MPSPIHHTDISHIRRGSLNFCDETSTDLSVITAAPDSVASSVASSSFELQPSTNNKIGKSIHSALRMQTLSIKPTQGEKA